ncbi:MAG TPA: LysR family transcriptional regulator [Candidatus Nitrosotalea sp.]|nr:LysR family transcriptional regulator [Candidatus Nitrosotalea sp.]
MLAFLALSESGSVTRAAARGHLSQSTVSHHLKAFERALGVRLVERLGRGLILTEAGRELVVPVRSALAGLRAVHDAALTMASLEVGRLKIGASQTTASHHLPAVLAEFLRQRPAVTIEVDPRNTREVCARVAGAELDLGLVEGPVTVSGLLERRLIPDEVVIVVSSAHPLAQGGRTRRQDLLEHRYLAREAGSGTEVLAERALGDVYRRLNRVQLGQMDAVRAAVKAGLGFAALPRVAVREELAAQSLRVLPIASRWRWVRAVRRPGPAGPALEALWRALIEHPWPQQASPRRIA